MKYKVLGCEGCSWVVCFGKKQVILEEAKPQHAWSPWATDKWHITPAITLENSSISLFFGQNMYRWRGLQDKSDNENRNMDTEHAHLQVTFKPMSPSLLVMVAFEGAYPESFVKPSSGAHDCQKEFLPTCFHLDLYHVSSWRRSFPKSQDTQNMHLNYSLCKMCHGLSSKTVNQYGHQFQFTYSQFFILYVYNDLVMVIAAILWNPFSCS